MQSVGSIFLVLLTMYSTNYLLSASKVPKKLTLSLNKYTDSIVHYRSGDNSLDNLENQFVSISKANRATVAEVSSENNIINCKKNKKV